MSALFILQGAKLDDNFNPTNEEKRAKKRPKSRFKCRFSSLFGRRISTALRFASVLPHPLYIITVFPRRTSPKSAKEFSGQTHSPGAAMRPISASIETSLSRIRQNFGTCTQRTNYGGITSPKQSLRVSILSFPLRP